MSREELAKWGDLVFWLCMTAGAQVSTAYICAYLFVKGLEK